VSDKPNIKYFGMGPWPIFCGFTMSPKAFAREMQRLKVDADVRFIATDHANATMHTFERDSGLICIITLEKAARERPIEQLAALLAHEAVHVVQELWARTGERDPRS
jgi:hypothetical protein